MVDLLERKIRMRAEQLYDERGRVEGLALEDWVRAESEVLKSSILAPLWNTRQQRELVEAQSHLASSRTKFRAALNFEPNHKILALAGNPHQE